MDANLSTLIKNLRERTGAGLMDCKRALEANNNDIDKACDWLREKGIAKAAAKADRIAAEGLTSVATCETCGATIILEINSETDFVAKSDSFKELVSNVAHLLLKNETKELQEGISLTKDLFTDATLKMGEKLNLRRFEIIRKQNAEQTIGTYIHMGGKISVVVLLDKNNPELAKGLAMHIAANNPIYINKDCIPAEVIEHELSIQKELAKEDEKLKGKPEDVLKRILDAKVAKILSEQTLCEQAYLLDTEKKVGDVLKSNTSNVLQFVRYAVGEGIEKKKDNFAEEVMSQTK